MLIPYEKLSPEALDGLIEEFVTRDGTELSEMDRKTQQVFRGLQAQRLVIVFDPEEGSCNIVRPEDLNETLDANTMNDKQASEESIPNPTDD